jgi:hypothetical protein
MSLHRKSEKQMPNYQLYREIAFRPEDWSILVKKMGELFRKDFDWSEQFALIKSSIMLVVERC